MGLRVFRCTLSFLLGLFVSACSPSRVEIGPEGGEVNGPHGAKLIIPEGALQHPVWIELKLASLDAPALPPGADGVSVFEVTPASLSLQLPAQLELPEVGRHCSQHMLTRGPLDSWVEVDGTSLANGLVVGHITHFGLFAAPPPSAPGLLGRLFWVEGPAVASSNLAGGDAHAIPGLSTPSPVELAVDSTNCRLFWTDLAGIFSAGFDGSGYQRLYFNQDLSMTANGIAVDAVAGRIFFGDGHLLRSAHLDGSALQTIAGSAEGHPITGVAVNPKSSEVFWTDTRLASIHRARYDGSEPSVVYTSMDAGANPRVLSVEAGAEQLFWVEGDSISTMKLDGSSPVTLVRGGLPTSIVSVLEAGVAFWSDSQKVSRMTLDHPAQTVLRQSAHPTATIRGLALYVGGP